MGRVCIAALILLAAARPSHAQEFPEAEDRDYALDLYSGAALGSVRIVGMGGTALATAEGSAGISANPAAPGVRPATSNDVWDWDLHADWLSPQLGSDFDNNGISNDDLSFKPFVTVGITGLYRQWALSFSGDNITTTSGVGDASDREVRMTLGVIHLVVARSLYRGQIVVGGGIRAGRLDVELFEGDMRTQKLFGLTGAGLEAGVLYKPTEQSYRVGASPALPISSDQQTDEGCPPADCEGYVLPDRVAVPWRVGSGVAYRFGPTPWNRQVTQSKWRDERAVIVAVDMVVTGAVDDGHGIEAFALRQLQPSGRKTAVSPRAGAEYEWIPGRLRVRGGTYWEPSRFKNPMGQNVRGRLHLTAGVDVRPIVLRLLGREYRVRLSLLFDGAKRYGNSGLSIGFWH